MGRTPAGETRSRVLGFVRERLLGGRPPTVREVQEAFGFRSPQTAREHLEGLVEEGRLDKEPGKARGYRLPAGDEGASTVLVPLLGHVPAGPLDEAIEDLEGYLPATARSRRHVARAGAGAGSTRAVAARARGGGGGDLFGLRVRGESMTGAGILSGDIVVVRRQARAEDGAIVVARVGDEATVKRLRLRRGRVELHAENPAFEPIVPGAGDAFEILGRVVEVRRILEG